MSKLRKARCPYCGRKVSLLSSWFLKTEGEYKCPKCGGYSNIVLDSLIILVAMLSVIFSGACLAFYLLFIKTFSWIILLLIFLPFFLFNFLSVFLIRLKKPVIRRRPEKGEITYSIEPPDPRTKDRQNNDNSRTIVMNYVKKM